MSDLVERLRESAKGWEIEAADEIERLEGANKILGQWVAGLEQVLGASRDEIDRLRGEVERLRGEK